MSAFEVATRRKAKLRLALAGPSGSGKTYTALAIAQGLVDDMGKVVLIDTENYSASYYADSFPGFMHGQLNDYSVEAYEDIFKQAIGAGAEVVILDSISPAWDEILRFVDDQQARNRGNKFAAWRDASPKHAKFVDMILRSPVHVIATLRVKTEWVVDEKGKPKKIGLAPKQREGLEYEFDMVGEIEADTHALMISKSRITSMADKTYRPGNREVGQAIRAWMDAGVDAPEEEGVASEPLSSAPDLEVPPTTEEKVKAVFPDAEKEAKVDDGNASKPIGVSTVRDIEEVIHHLQKVDGDTDYGAALAKTNWNESEDAAQKVLKRMRTKLKQLEKERDANKG